MKMKIPCAARCCKARVHRIFHEVQNKAHSSRTKLIVPKQSSQCQNKAHSPKTKLTVPEQSSQSQNKAHSPRTKLIGPEQSSQSQNKAHWARTKLKLSQLPTTCSWRKNTVLCSLFKALRSRSGTPWLSDSYISKKTGEERRGKKT